MQVFTMNAKKLSGWLAVLGAIGLIAAILTDVVAFGTTITANYIVGVSLSLLALAGIIYVFAFLLGLYRETSDRQPRQVPPPD